MRSSLSSIHDAVKATPFDHDVHHPGHCAGAAHGSLKPPPTRRLRRAILHLSYSMTLARLLDTATTRQSVPLRRIGTFGLAVAPLVPFPLASPARFSSSVQEPERESRPLYTGHLTDGKQVSSVIFPEHSQDPGFDVIIGLSMLHLRFVCTRLSHPHMTRSSRAF